MEIAVFTALALLLYIFLVIWMVTRLRYQITRRHFRISLFGLTLRRIPLSNIHSVTKRRAVGLAENWWNTLHPGHRLLVIRLRRGWRPNIVITPRNRYVFKSNLERALAHAASGSTTATDSDLPPHDSDPADEPDERTQQLKAEM